MKKLLCALLLLGFSTQALTMDTPEQHRKKFVKFYSERFPSVTMKEFGNGAYAIDAKAREQWVEYEEFPPYEIYVDEGKELFEKPFANGKTYASCFENSGIGIRQNYPRFKNGKVETLESSINKCRTDNGEKALKYGKGEMAVLSSYMAWTSRGKKTNVTIPNEQAKKAFESGKKFYYTKRGQLNFSCADCHMKGSGSKVRVETLSPALGHTTGFPVYRIKWQGLGTLQRRFSGCNKNIRAKPFPLQGDEYRNLEYYLSYVNNGLEINGPSARK